MSSPPAQTLIEDFLIIVLQSSMEDRKISLYLLWRNNRRLY